MKEDKSDRVFRFGSSLYPNMIKSIRNAEEEVLFEYYIVRWDRAGKKFIKELKRAADRGVDVKIIIDGFGSWKFPERVKNYLRNSGVQLIHYNPVKLYKGIWKWVLRDHRKIMIIDGKTAYIGGMNIDKKHLEPEDQPETPRKEVIKDTHIKVNDSAAKKIRNKFIESWNVMQKEEELQKKEIDEETSDTVVKGGNIKTEDSILKEYSKRIKDAEDSIKLTQSYFVPQKIVRKQLYSAVERGVDVKLIVPEYFSEVRIARHATKNLYEELLKNGIDIYEYRDTFIHSKTAVFDSEWATVGSLNLDFQGVLTNLEINLFTRKKETVEKLDREFESDLENSVRITEEDVKNRFWVEKGLNKLFYAFRALY